MSVKWRSMFIFIHHTAICPGTICWADYLFPSDCHWHPFQDQLTINMKIYFQTRQSPPPTHPYFSHAIGIAGFTVSSSRGKWDLSNLVQICINDSGYCADKMISVCCFQDSLSLVVCAAMCLGVNLFELPLLGISWASWMCWKSGFSSDLGHVLLLLQILFLPLSIVSLSEISVMLMLVCVCSWYPSDAQAPSTFLHPFLFFFRLHSLWWPTGRLPDCFQQFPWDDGLLKMSGFESVQVKTNPVSQDMQGTAKPVK